jgi:predicted ATPase
MELGDELQDYLTQLKGLELIYEKSLFPDLEYRFKHSLTQEVAYNSLLIKRRKELHGKIGEIIEDLYGDKLEENYELLAYHYGRSHCAPDNTGVAQENTAGARTVPTVIVVLQ